MDQTALNSAIQQWRQQLGEDAVINAPQCLAEFTDNCTAIGREIAAVIRVSRREQVAGIVAIAAHHAVAIHPYSTGNNWGYGSKNPSRDGLVLLDLSALNRIIDFDADSGLLTIEPGVTQRQLYQYLVEHELPFLVPVTGAGPDCSLLGNALERGYGITPHADHFAAVMSLEAVLPNGEIYRSMLDQLGGEAVSKAYKWGLGPYLDGLFSQSNFGIVTQMTIALAAKPESVLAFFFSIKQDRDLEKAADAIRLLLRQLGPVLGSINLMNKHRVVSMSEPYPLAQLGSDGLIPEPLLNELMRRNRISEWNGIGAIYGSKAIAAAARSEVRKILRPIADQLHFFTPAQVAGGHQLVSNLPLLRQSKLKAILTRLDNTMKIFAGQPSEVALPLAYWRSGNTPPAGKSMNPDRDRCGLLWYAPLLTMNPQSCRDYVEWVKAVCIKHGIEPLITLTSLSERCWSSSIPLLFDRHDPQAREQAYQCYQELLVSGRTMGFLPYRLGAHSMSFPARHQATPALLQILKQAVDPHNILSPGRYGL